MVRMGVDPGAWVSAVAVVRVEREEAEILHTEMVPNELLPSRVAALAETHGVEEAVIERPSKGPWKRGVPKEHLKVLKAVGDELEKVLKERGVSVKRPLPSRADAWYGEGSPGWRQRLTGLCRPSEEDVRVVLRGLARRKALKGPVPKTKHLVDAVGMTLV